MSHNLKNRFAVINTWPHFQAAEHEAMERIRNAAIAIGKECIFVDRYLNKIEERIPTELQPNEVDFVINLHFESGKVYDAFSFCALWNPVRFYYDWGYQNYIKHVDSHDDFLTCGSPWADDQIARRLRGDLTRLPPEFALYHSLANPVIPPKLDDNKSLFYCGINWEKLGKPKGRYHDVLEFLDQTGDLKIFGPREFHGVQPWEGFKSYVGPILFDGKSVVRAIASCGVALVFSSDAHKESGLMSARMYESLAAGAVIIADENPFVRDELGDDALYVDGTLTERRVFEQIQKHLSWIRANPAQAHAMAVRAQEKFKEKYAMDRSLRDIYAGLQSRKAKLRDLSLARNTTRKVHLLFPIVENDEKQILAAIDNLRIQTYENITGTLIIDADIYVQNQRRIDFLAERILSIHLCSKLVIQGITNQPSRRYQRIGAPFVEYCHTHADDLVMMVDPAERLFSEHVSRLVRKFEDIPATTCAASDLIIRHFDSKNTEYREIRSGLIAIDQPLRAGETIGWGRFLFAARRVVELGTMVRYLDHATMVPMLFDAALDDALAYTRHATVMIDVQRPTPRVDGVLNQEREILLDGFRFQLPRLAPFVTQGSSIGFATSMTPAQPPDPEAISKAILEMAPKARERILVSLIKAVPQPWIAQWFLKRFYGLNPPN